MSDDARNEYLKKIQAVEQMDRDLVKGKGNDYSAEDTTTNTPAGTTSAGDAPTVGSTDYTIPPIKTYPEKIQLPSCGRSEYDKAATEYAQANITNTDVFTTLDSERFDQQTPRFTGEGYLRKDFVYYLNELHDLVAPKLGMDKLYITSTFRTKAHSDWIYRNSKNKPKYGEHLGAIAADIAATGEDRYVIADTAYYMGFGGIAVGENFVHVDISVKDTWGYPPVPTYYSPDRKKG